MPESAVAAAPDASGPGDVAPEQRHFQRVVPDPVLGRGVGEGEQAGTSSYSMASGLLGHASSSSARMDGESGGAVATMVKISRRGYPWSGHD